MGLFDKLFTKKQQQQTVTSTFQSLTAYQPTFTSYGGAIYESELVRAAIDASARHISKLKVEFTGPAKSTLKTMCKQSPNAFMTWSQFLYRLATIYQAQNTAFIVPIKDVEYNTLTGYYPVLPTKCDIVQAVGEPYLRYRFANGQEAAERLVECGIMTKFQYYDDFFGEDNSALVPTMDLIGVQNTGIKEAVKNSNTFRFMAKMNNFAKDEDLAKEQKRFTENSIRGDGGVLLFPNTWSDIKQVVSKPYTVDQAQTEAINRNVCNYFGVNEDIMQGKAKGEELDAFFNSTIEPFAVQLSEVLTKMTYTLRERNTGNEILCTANRLQYMTPSQKVAVVQQMGDRGMLTVNEGRELFNYPPIEGGDTTMIRGEYYNGADKLGEENGQE